MSSNTVELILATDVATGATFTVGYPDGTTKGTFAAGRAHKMFAAGIQALFEAPTDFTVSLGASSATVTYNGATTLKAGTKVYFEFDAIGPDEYFRQPAVAGTANGEITFIDLGTPAAADADGVCASQAIAAADGGDINGALASGGVATFDVPRNVVAAWTTTAVMTVTGTDVDGNVIVESSASGTSLAGKKAFKTVTDVAVSVDVTGATVGTGDVFGLPVYLPGTGYVLKELQDGATATAGTIVAGVPGAQTATTCDIRGTYDPNAAADGSKAFALIAALPDPFDRGGPQFSG